ncbi:MAG: flagellar biosynthesis protein FlhF [Phycisphaerales bacterium]
MAAMNIKTYRAPTMAQALGEVKKDLGSDAVILHTRTYKEGGMLGVGAKQIVEITASDSAAAAGPRIRQTPQDSGDFTPTRFNNVRVPEIPQVPARVEVAAARREEPIVESKPVARKLAAATVPIAPANGAATDELRNELASIKSLVGQLLKCSRDAAAGGAGAAGVLALGGLPEALMDVYLKLQASGVSVPNSEQIILKIREALDADALRDATKIRECALRVLSGMLPVVAGVQKPQVQSDGRPLTVMFVGPTGVGKTTTIAKLAAAYKLKLNRRVGMITADTYRIAAVDQLRTYAHIIGLPVKVAMTPQEVATHVDGFAGYDVVFIDTAGRSQHDSPRLDELRQISELVKPHQTHLVVSAAMAEPVTLATIERFRQVGPDRMIISKLDEAVSFGSLVNISQSSGLPISNVTTGQEVPDDIEAADAMRLAKLVLDGELRG